MHNNFVFLCGLMVAYCKGSGLFFCPGIHLGSFSNDGKNIRNPLILLNIFRPLLKKQETSSLELFLFCYIEKAQSKILNIIQPLKIS